MFNYLIVILLVTILWYLQKNRKIIKDLNIKLNLLEDQQAKDKKDIIDTLNRQYTDVMLNLKKLEPEEKRELEDNNYYDKAKEIVIKSGKASATLLQRVLRLGYAQSARLLDALEKAGIVGPADGVNPRGVFPPSESKEYIHDEDELLPAVIEFVSQLKTVSPTRIQRKFRIGYARSARLLDILEEKGIAGSSNGIKPRKVLSK